RRIEPGDVTETDRPLGFAYPEGLYSLSHVALPFPVTDSLYGLTPDPTEDFGLHLGSLAPRGERNVLIASLDSLLRASSNPFFPYMIDRIGEGIAHPDAGKAVKPGVPDTSPYEDTGDWTGRGTLSVIAGFLRGQPEDTNEPP